MLWTDEAPTQRKTAMEQMGTTQAYLAAVQVEETRDHILKGKLGPNTVLEAQQILGMMELPDVPNSPLLVKGMLQGQGESIPLVDLRVRLEAASAVGSRSASAIIVELEGSQVGLIVDTGSKA